jgi:hypothetical protein
MPTIAHRRVSCSQRGVFPTAIASVFYTAAATICRGPGFDSRRYQIFSELVGLEMGPLRLVSTTEELFESNSSGSGLEIREYGRRDPLCWPRDTFHPQKLAPTSPTNGGCSVGMVRSRTKATEFVVIVKKLWRDCVHETRCIEQMLNNVW